MHVELDIRIAEEEIQDELRLPIFRITQEALNNVAKHSRAALVNISLAKNGNGIELIISDDGVGMDLGKILGKNTTKGAGMMCMRERAGLSGGTLSIDSARGMGTMIRTRWPETEGQETECQVGTKASLR